MAESQVHIDALIYIREALMDYFRHTPNIYIGATMLLYYEEGNPAASVAPDVFVVKGISKEKRRIYQLWVEGKPPDVIFEITSRSTRIEDLAHKRGLYTLLGVSEYFLYDPLQEYLDPPLQGFRLREGEYERLKPDAEGRLLSQELGLALQLVAGELRLMDPLTGRILLTPLEGFESARVALERAQREAERARHEAERAQREAAAREAAEARARAAEAEVERLRAEIKKLRGA